MLASPKFSEVFKPGSHGSTFGGNPVACAAALAVIQAIEDEKLLDAAAQYGKLFMEGLQQFVEQYEPILEVRGMGLMIGLVVDGNAADIVDNLRLGGLLACVAGPNVVRFLPPLCISDKDLEEALDMIGETLDEMFGEDAEDGEDAGDGEDAE
ncbi:MAG: aminotransferase class III-fold pyridoxal phosphate-dependent enzyme [Atribacter sp.]|uniref:aminotransferase class III-fold pyridoxal phosphate-dependent enzyme n=1 Tax=Atribacter sp. TaxID=2847780 RepID=UPI003D98E790